MDHWFTVMFRGSLCRITYELAGIEDVVDIIEVNDCGINVVDELTDKERERLVNLCECDYDEYRAGQIEDERLERMEYRRRGW